MGRPGRATPTTTATCSRPWCLRATCCSSCRPRRNTVRGSWPASSPRSPRAGRCSSCRRTPRAIPTSAPTGSTSSRRRGSTCRGSSGSTPWRPPAARPPASRPRRDFVNLSPRSTRNSWAVPPGACAAQGRSISPTTSHGKRCENSSRSVRQSLIWQPAWRVSGHGSRRSSRRRSRRGSGRVGRPGNG